MPMPMYVYMYYACQVIGALQSIIYLMTIMHESFCSNDVFYDNFKYVNSVIGSIAIHFG